MQKLTQAQPDNNATLLKNAPHPASVFRRTPRQYPPPVSCKDDRRHGTRKNPSNCKQNEMHAGISPDDTVSLAMLRAAHMVEFLTL
ncbi:hypothetical protein [Aestuariivita boseongensis]|uniref:hypothetical protein n=1 Tax=Aestuariivita boseongensis TaxID=1470562 RepID=UPI0012F9E66F|nr:hypothetical protein [Aestuariivita boseongensis]